MKMIRQEISNNSCMPYHNSCIHIQSVNVFAFLRNIISIDLIGNFLIYKNPLNSLLGQDFFP